MTCLEVVDGFGRLVFIIALRVLMSLDFAFVSYLVSLCLPLIPRRPTIRQRNHIPVSLVDAARCSPDVHRWHFAWKKCPTTTSYISSVFVHKLLFFGDLLGLRFGLIGSTIWATIDRWLGDKSKWRQLRRLRLLLRPLAMRTIQIARRKWIFLMHLEELLVGSSLARRHWASVDIWREGTDCGCLERGVRTSIWCCFVILLVHCFSCRDKGVLFVFALHVV